MYFSLRNPWLVRWYGCGRFASLDSTFIRHTHCIGAHSLTHSHNERPTDLLSFRMFLLCFRFRFFFFLFHFNSFFRCCCCNEFGLTEKFAGARVYRRWRRKEMKSERGTHRMWHRMPTERTYETCTKIEENNFFFA